MKRKAVIVILVLLCMSTLPLTVADEGNGGAWFDGFGDESGVEWKGNVSVQDGMVKFELTPIATTEEFIICNDTRDQDYPRIAVDSNDNFIATWQGRSATGYDWIYAKRFNNDGSPIGNNIEVYTPEAHERYPAIAVDSNDNFTICWDGGSIFAKQYSNQGQVVWNEKQLHTGDYPAIATFSDNSFIICWEENTNIYAQHYDSSGNTVGNLISLCTESGYQEDLDVAVNSNDEFIVVWEDTRENGDEDVYMRRYSSGGNLIGDEIIVCNATDKQRYPSIATDDNDNIVVTWQDRRAGDHSDIYARCFDATGNPKGPDFPVFENYSDAGVPQVSFDHEGNFAICSMINKGGNFGISLKFYDKNGSQIGDEVEDDDSSNTANFPEIAVDSQNNYIVAWTDSRNGDSDIFGRKYTIGTNASGSIVSTLITLPEYLSWSTLTINKTEPLNSYLNVSLIDNATNQTITGFANIRNNGSIDISSIDFRQHPVIRLKATFEGNGSNTPVLHSWGVNWTNLRPVLGEPVCPASIYRTENLNVSVPGSDHEQNNSELNFSLEYKLHSSPAWSVADDTNISQNSTKFFFNISMPAEADLGMYDMRFRLNDSLDASTGWRYYNSTLLVKNNLPGFDGLDVSAGAVNRTDNTTVTLLKITDIETPFESMNVTLWHRLNGTAEWNKSYISVVNKQDGNLTLHFTPSSTASLGLYDLKVELDDGDNVSVYQYPNQILVKNSLPSIEALEPDFNEVFRFSSVTLNLDNLTDAETDPGDMGVSVYHRLNGSAQWDDSWLDVEGQGGKWTCTFSPPDSALLGLYDFRVELNDGDDTVVFYYPNLVSVKNVLPVMSDLNATPSNALRTVPCDLILSGLGDAETPIGDLNITYQIRENGTTGWQGLTATIESISGNNLTVRTVFDAGEPLGPRDVKVTINDGDDIAVFDFYNVLSVINNPPVIAGELASLTLAENHTTAFPLTPYAEDVEDEPAELSWFCNASSVNHSYIEVLSIEAGNLTITPVPGVSGTTSLELILSDSDGGTCTRLISVNILPRNEWLSVHLDAPGNGTLQESSSVNLTWSRFSTDSTAQVRYDVYFGSTLGNVVSLSLGCCLGNTTDEYYTVTGLDNGTYYWKVIPVNATATGVCRPGYFTFNVSLPVEPDLTGGYNVTIGPILDGNGTVVQGVWVNLTYNGSLYSGITGGDGKATITGFPVPDIPPGTNITAEKGNLSFTWKWGEAIPAFKWSTGGDDTTGDDDTSGDDDVTGDDEDDTTGDDTSGDDSQGNDTSEQAFLSKKNIFIGAFGFVGALIGLIVGIIVLRKRGQRTETTPEAPTEAPDPEESPSEPPADSTPVEVEDTPQTVSMELSEPSEPPAPVIPPTPPEVRELPDLPEQTPSPTPSPTPPPVKERKSVSPAIANLIPGYILSYQLGSGGFATVYKATGPDGKEYAIKLPKFIDETLDSSVLQKFKAEADIWGKLKHKNIVTFYEGDIRPIPYMVIEYMEGGNLMDVLKGGLMPIDRAIHLIKEILSGMAYAHRMASVHRDIKPENILFTRDGVPKISDWGIGKFMASASTTKTVGTKGTLAYSSPEQVAKERFGEVDWSTDVFQLGLIFYEMLTGVNPVMDEDPVSIISNLIMKVPAPPSELRVGIPPEVDAVILQALEKEKEKRFSSADSMLQEMKRIKRGK